MENSVTYIKRLLHAIGKRDKLHAKTLRRSMESMRGREYWRLAEIIQTYFINNGVKVKQLSEDYLHMVNDMRIEMKYFEQTGEYSCKNEKEAYGKVYSNPGVMGYYMNALLISQILWTHHFEILKRFTEQVVKYGGKGNGESILDIGSGHGLFSKIMKDNMPNIRFIDVVDISERSISMVKSFLGTDKVNYFTCDIMDFDRVGGYDIIILGEILEHLDNPLRVLKHAVSLLDRNGVIWITIPINAPAIDHVYLFDSPEMIDDLVESAGLNYLIENYEFVDGQTSIMSAFCIKK